ncbi:unnamed protein product [Dicrocoelium dendriticum]|nr:unnamed protein product [Dicrocoelium dendriticum]
MVYVPGLVAIIIFYVLILGVGFWAARRSKKLSAASTESEEVMLAGRNIGLIVGIFTMTATWVGGGYINGTAENTFKLGQGLAWCQAPIGYALSLIVGGMFFANRMRSLSFVTMLDPLQNKYGERMCGLLFIPALLGELFWTAAILSALGATLSVIVDLNQVTSVIVSACIALLYTVFGGLYSVAYTDVVQLFCIFIGLWLTIPFAMTNEATTPIDQTWDRWKGAVEPIDALSYADNLLMLTFGGIPWQVYFQRVLSCKGARQAQILSYVASLGCFLMAIPSVLIGAVGASTDWNMTTFEGAVNSSIPSDQAKLVLPLVMRYLCPTWVSFVGLGAVSAAVMSSADSSVLSAASMFARNVVKSVFWQTASEHQIIWVMRVSIFAVGAFACLLAIYIQSIYGLWYFCSDLVYVILFPQLICVLYVRFSNTYGSLIGYVVGLFVRLTAGEALLGLPALFEYPYFYDHPTEFYQRFPCKTFAMICSLTFTISVSFVTDFFFRADSKHLKYDIFHCYKQRQTETGSMRIGNRFNRKSIRIPANPICVEGASDVGEASVDEEDKTATVRVIDRLDATGLTGSEIEDDVSTASVNKLTNPAEKKYHQA